MVVVMSDLSSRHDRLSGRTALVTGAAGGIGRACAEAFAAAGASVLVLDRDADGAHAVAESIGGKALVADLARPDTLTEDGLLGGVDADVVVNNAGFQHVAPLPDFDPDVFAAMLRVQVESPFRLARALLPGMYARGWGRFVHLSSVHGLRASPYKSAYVTAKHALEGLSKSIAVEGASHGVTSNTICPGYVRTPMVEGQLADQAVDPRHRRAAGARRGAAGPHPGQAPGRARRGRPARRLPVRARQRVGLRLVVRDVRRLDGDLTATAPIRSPLRGLS